MAFNEERSHPNGWNKEKLVSRYVTEGVESAPHRSYYYAMGLTEEEIHQPLVGVATCWNEAAPCNIALSRQAQAVKKGVKVVPSYLLIRPCIQGLIRPYKALECHIGPP